MQLVASSLRSYTEVIRSSLKSVYADMDTKATWQTPWPELAKRVVAFEQRLARVLASGIDAADPNLTYNPHNTSALVELAPFLHWRDYFSGFSPRPRLPDPVIVAEPDYLRRMSAIVRDEDDETLETYLVFRSAQTYGPMLGPREPVRKEVTRLESYLSGVDAGVRADSEAACLTALINNAGFLVRSRFVGTALTCAGRALLCPARLLGAREDVCRGHHHRCDRLVQGPTERARLAGQLDPRRRPGQGRRDRAARPSARVSVTLTATDRLPDLA